MKWLFLLLAIICNSAGNVLIKRFLVSRSINSVLDYIDPYFILGLGLFGINVLFYAKALERIPLVVAYPVLIGLSVVAVSLAAVTLFGERLSIVHVAAIAMIFGGVAILANASG